MSAPTPPGWYPDPAGAGGARWWTGRDWAAGPAVRAVGEAPRRSPGTPTGTRWAYAQALLPLTGVVAYVPYLLSFTGYFHSLLQLQQQAGPDGRLPDGGAAMLAEFGRVMTAFAVTAVLQLVVLAAMVVLSALDARELARRGIAQPFPWPWALLGPVYPIGRAVVVHRRTGGGLGPLWVLIAASVLAFAGQAVLMAVVVGGAFSGLAPSGAGT